MNWKSEHIGKLCKELLELGINLEPKTMELILRMQEQDFRNLTKGVDTATEFEHLLSKIKTLKSSQIK